MDHRKITRKSLGRSASIGDLYDATNDSFCGQSIFPKLNAVEIETIENPAILSRIIINDDSLFNNLIKFDIEPDLAVSLWFHYVNV